MEQLSKRSSPMRRSRAPFGDLQLRESWLRSAVDPAET
jgi:hypothetical protein